MPEDCRKGFLRFQTDDFQFTIANERALNAPGLNKGFNKEFNGACSFADPGNALVAVQAAAFEKALRNDFPSENLNDTPNDVGASDFFVEDYNMFL